MSDLRYPIGKFQAPVSISESDRVQAIKEIASFPLQFLDAASGLNDQQLDTRYRPEGWTVRSWFITSPTVT
ncbi:MAG: hypothetical protein WKF37_04565 [Bryobacteraceae bacterium]